MKLPEMSHTSRISFGLVMLTISILLLSDFLGIVPNGSSSELQARKTIAETVAVQISSVIVGDQFDAIQDVLDSLVKRNDQILSAALRGSSGALIEEAGGHRKHWQLKQGERSTAEQVRVPIYRNGHPWGWVELSFTRLGGVSSKGLLQNSFLALIIFLGLGGYLVYLLFLKRALKELDPQSVVPDRVRSALDTLAEGLLVLDKNGCIVFSNLAFAEKTGLLPRSLIGKKCADLGWVLAKNDEDLLPWEKVTQGQELESSVQLQLQTELREQYTFQVNASPIYGKSNEARGVLVTFNDVTELEVKNEELNQTLGKLKQSQREIARQNQELLILATRDPLTNCLNRRSFFEGFKTLFEDAREQGDELSCIMADIDHFKSINDRFGHATGDKVIKLVVRVLIDTVRPQDLVGRYGGEEFCIVLQGANKEHAAAVAERMRLAFSEGNDIKFTSAVRITASFGVSALSEGAADPHDLVDQADKALYVAKESGRNRVVKWPGEIDEGSSKDAPPVASTENSNTEGASVTPLRAAVVTQNSDDPTAQLRHRVHELEQALFESENARSEQYSNNDNVCVRNNALLFDRITQEMGRAKRYGTRLAVLIIDVDTLQRINDALGPTMAEKILRDTSRKLKQILRSTDTVAIQNGLDPSASVSRISNDRFAIVLSDLKNIESVVHVVKRIFNGLKNPFVSEGNEIYLSANIGLSMFPEDGQAPEELISHASNAMSEAKKSIGRNSYVFYSREIDQRLKKRVRLENELVKALEHGDLLLHYQPKIELMTGRITGMEALVRWKHPRLGIVPPNDFIPLAEQSGMIDMVGSWVVRTACQQARLWRDMGLGRIPIAINLSPLQFRNKDFAAQLLALIEASDMTPDILELEITESVVMNNVDSAVGIMKTFKQAGMKISLDDFGTGYSSLSWLKRFPLDKVKIDRTFLMDILDNSEDASLVGSIIAMAHGMGLSVVAEGVENKEQLRFLHDLQCDEIQGYFISKPIPRDDITRMLEEPGAIRSKIVTAVGHLASAAVTGGQASVPDMNGVLNDISRYQGRALGSGAGKM